MAHLLEHMLFKQTKTHKDIFKELKDRGAIYNGTTHFDRTNYYEAFTPTDDNLRWRRPGSGPYGELADPEE